MAARLEGQPTRNLFADLDDPLRYYVRDYDAVDAAAAAASEAGAVGGGNGNGDGGGGTGSARDDAARYLRQDIVSFGYAFGA